MEFLFSLLSLRRIYYIAAHHDSCFLILSFLFLYSTFSIFFTDVERIRRFPFTCLLFQNFIVKIFLMFLRVKETKILGRCNIFMARNCLALRPSPILFIKNLMQVMLLRFISNCMSYYLSHDTTTLQLI
jgi:hypothetical protein